MLSLRNLGTLFLYCVHSCIAGGQILQQPFQAAQPAQASVATVCTHALSLFISFLTLDNNLEHKTDILNIFLRNLFRLYNFLLKLEKES